MSDRREKLRVWRKRFDRLVREDESKERERQRDIDLLVRRQAASNAACRRLM